MAGTRALVVGASAGIGRAIAADLIADGARVVVTARRADALEELVRDAGGGVVVAADIRDDAACARVVDTAVDALGGLDLVVICVGVAPLRKLADTTAADWRQVFDTNTIGVHQVVRAALPALGERATVAVLSSETVGRPRAGLVAYASSKAALEESLRGWRAEHPGIRFTCVTVGATVPTDFGTDFDADVLTAVFEEWTRHGLWQEEFMDTEHVARVIVDTLASAAANPTVGIEQLTIRSPSAIIGRPTVDDAPA
jgi:NAD(P)-dependent dehydrogenase (short-subunit alcohol dehydrogenase family)